MGQLAQCSCSWHLECTAHSAHHVASKLEHGRFPSPEGKIECTCGPARVGHPPHQHALARWLLTRECFDVAPHQQAKSSTCACERRAARRAKAAGRRRTPPREWLGSLRCTLQFTGLNCWLCRACQPPGWAWLHLLPCSACRAVRPPACQGRGQKERGSARPFISSKLETGQNMVSGGSGATSSLPLGAIGALLWLSLAAGRRLV